MMLRKIRTKLQEIYIPVQVIIGAAILSVTFFFVFLDSFRTYQSDISVLIIGRNQEINAQLPQIIPSLSEFPKFLSFYEAMLKRNSAIADDLRGLAPDQRKEKWNDALSVKTSNNIVTFSIRKERKQDSEQISRSVARTFSDIVSQYYNIKTDLDIRIVDGPITKAAIPAWYWLVLASVVLGFALSLAINIIIEMIPQVFRKGKDIVTPVFPKISRQQFNEKQQQKQAEERIMDEPQISEEEIRAFEEKITFEEPVPYVKEHFEGKYPNFPEMPKSHTEKHQAPENLPFVTEEEYLKSIGSANLQQDEKKQQQHQEEIPGQHPASEPNEEEIKRRLNQLLRGQM